MPFSNNKKTFLAKLDKSKKGSIDAKVVDLVDKINKHENLYTTSSCSGRVYFHNSAAKKNQTQWLNVSHDLIKEDFFELDNKEGSIWLRLEPFIMHICTDTLESANELLEKTKPLFKKSCILSASNKIIVELRGSEFIEMPFYEDSKLLYNGDLQELLNIINTKLKNNFKKIKKIEKIF